MLGVRRGIRIVGFAVIGICTTAVMLATTLYLAMWILVWLVSLDGGGGSGGD